MDFPLRSRRSMLSKQLSAHLTPPLHFHNCSQWGLKNYISFSTFSSFVLVAKLSRTLWDPMNRSPPDSSVHGIFRQEYWSALPFPPPGDLPDPGFEFVCLLLWQADSLPLSHQGNPLSLHSDLVFLLCLEFYVGKSDCVNYAQSGTMITLPWVWSLQASACEWPHCHSGDRTAFILWLHRLNKPYLCSSKWVCSTHSTGH